MIGDVNLDGLVNVADLTLMVNFILHKVLHTAQQIANADIKPDGMINILDMVKLIKMIMGK